MSDFVAAFLVLIAIATAGNFAIGSDAINTQCVNGFLGICF